MTSPPQTANERWDTIADEVRNGAGEWVMIGDGTHPRHEKVKQNLERRGLEVEVTTRMGDGSEERPWSGVRTWARTI
jgi:hypothetical protein